MHQPYYRDLATGGSSMPWVRLHATKDYLDMVKRLDEVPVIHQTFNLVPSLLDQLEEYLPPASRSDEFLELSRKPAASLTDAEQRFLLRWFFLTNLDRMIRPSPRYHDLLAKRGLRLAEEDWPKIQKRFHPQDYLDLQVWFNLAWIDPWLRSSDPELARLESKGAHFTEEEKRVVLDRQLALMGQVIPAYREAAARGQIELTTSPYYHPIMPLLCDLRAALAALPQLRLPDTPFRHPDDARWQLEEAIRRHTAAFGAPPAGVWPPEGSVSEAFVKLALECQVRWIATDEELLWRTLKSPRTPSALYRAHLIRRKEGELAIIFRDRELSDLIGFVYSQWEAKLAVSDFLRRLGELHGKLADAPQPGLVSVILDGENAWESYPNDGHEFLQQLYRSLAADARFRCVTVSEYLAQYPVGRTPSLPELFSGSWIDANFATWIGHSEKNAAWRLLSQAREGLAARDRHDPRFQQAWRSFGAAEGSDWMWWFGDTHFSAQAEEFDRLFRLHLANAYQLAGLLPPSELKTSIRKRAVPALYGPTGLLRPTIDGRETSYYEWLYAGRLDLRAQYAAIHRADQCLRRLYYGFDPMHYYLRFDVDREGLKRLRTWTILVTLWPNAHVQITSGPQLAARVLAPAQGAKGAKELSCALGTILELAIPRELVGPAPDDQLHMTLELLEGGDVLERYPSQGTFALSVSKADLEVQAWSA